MKQSFDIIKMWFHSPLHLSKGKPDLDSSDEILHSDKLKSALFVSALQLFGTTAITKENFLERFDISSAFPFMEEEYFFPKPLVKLPFEVYDQGGKQLEISKGNKQLKNIKYLGLSYLEKILHRKREDHPIPAGHILQKGKFLSDQFVGQKEMELIYKQQGQRVRVPKLEEHELVNGDPKYTQANPFYIERLYFQKQAGLYFLIKLKDPSDSSLKGQLQAALKLLEDSGIGYHRNIGNGQFYSEWRENGLCIDVPDKAAAWLSLSLYCPKEEELDGQLLGNSNYSLIKRGGWISSPENLDHLTLRKKSIYMFKEGAVFPFKGDQQKVLTRGKVVDLKPNVNGVNIHSIWRDGQAIFLPICTGN